MFNSVVFVKEKTAYEMHISDWSSDVCSSDLATAKPWHDGIVANYSFAFSCPEALNRTDLDAAILIGSPVCGLRPLRAARLLTLKVPKPTIVKPPSFFIALPIASNTASTASPAAALVQPAVSRTISIRSALFIDRKSTRLNPVTNAHLLCRLLL